MDILMLNTELPSRKKREITEEVCGCHGGDMQRVGVDARGRVR